VTVDVKKDETWKMPLLIIANSPSEKAAQDSLQQWKDNHPDAAALLAVDDVLVDRMREDRPCGRVFA
jgi:hypothetical protein